MTPATLSLVEQGAASKCTVLLGDVHPLFRSGMRYMLQNALAPAEVVEAGSRTEILSLLEAGSFDLVVTSLFSNEGEWDHFLADLLQRAPAGRVVILSSVNEPTRICRILTAGAAGFVLKETPPDITLQAIRLVLAGGVYIPAAALGALARAVTPEPDAITPAADLPLTARQHAVLSLIVQGASNKAIARTLGLSAGTVKGHVASLLRLYGAENRTELVIAATRRSNSGPTGR
jgi:DNA-binding NarL/FixJ family response regulator